ncbi:MAG: 2Fe-2S iron-sulfur cluster binding domain-containing protein [Bacteroidales bacterium]|jgi:[NiFe] hydrogenase diaphorase moiety small subunit|nr:2Fe-2S iron-sulfur cluster-binding protein [Bacteroidales bacterium]MDY0315070.1 2Fe-2S iron-sulfur cluster-binding protein [Bacteroidales bacterium]NLB87304.1 2Fe-2S iron-sulfur cluster binding domain-containing protein [Bacteroidales bacterium]
MNEIINITIDGKEIQAKKGQMILEAAANNGIYIPTLCNYEGVKPKASCRICTVKVNGRYMTACTTPVGEGMNIESDISEITDIRKAIIEAIFVEGNHFCPACEKSGNCELQALAYRYLMMVPRFPYAFPQRPIEAENSKLLLDKNRCILCMRCVRGLKDEQGKSMFAVKYRGIHAEIIMDEEVCANISDEMAQKAMDICPVGVIIKKEVGFSIPIGSRKYDNNPIGYEIENK